MSESNTSEYQRVRTKRWAMTLVVVWTGLVLASLVWNVLDTRRDIVEQARMEARGAYNKDLSYRLWATRHGGVYVPLTEDTPPNPYLSHLEDRDVVTLSGKRLTLMNPAYMTRQVHELTTERYGLKGHITSLNPIRPGNAADDWETNALESFESGVAEVSEVAVIEGEPHMRLMKPMMVEERCLKCHAQQGYDVGDIRGGISVSVPMEPYNALANSQTTRLVLCHVLVWFLGLVGIGAGNKSVQEQARERSRVQSNLRESNKKYRRLVDNLAGGFLYRHDTNGVFTYISPSITRVLGYSPEEFLTEFTQHLTDHPVNKEVRERTALSIQGIQQPPYEVQLFHKDGNVCWLEVSEAPVFDDDGQVIAVEGIAHDMTNRKQAEEEIWHLAKFPSQDPNPVLKVALDGTILYANEAAAPLLNAWGCSEGQRLDGRLWELTADVFSSGKRKELEVECEEQIYSLCVAPIISENYVNIYGHDITERKFAEEERTRLATAIEQAAEAIVITDSEGIIEYVNPAFEKVSGYSRAEALGNTPRILKSGKQDPAFYRGLWGSLARGEVWRGHLINKNKDGSFFEEESTISPVLNDKGEVTHYVAVNRDVTHEAELESQLRQSQKMEALGTLAGGIAHDFNNVLSAILGYADLAMNGLPQDSKSRKDLTEVVKAGHRASDLVRQILAFSRKTEQGRKPVRLSPILKEALKLVRSSLPSTIDIQQNIDCDCPPVLVDATQIHQVIMNLCTNAYHSMEENGGTLTVTLEETEVVKGLANSYLDLEPGEYACLTVYDTGHGMDNEARLRVFEPYFTTKPEGKGTGMGLATVHGIVKSHNGDINVESQPGKGTTFKVYLPTFSDMEEEQLQDEQKGPRGHGEHILLVDDEENVLMSQKRLLERNGYKVTSFSLPEDALENFLKDPSQYDVLITDNIMPKMTGTALAAEILSINPSLPTILVTGLIDENISSQVSETGIQAILPKPSRINELAITIHDLIAKSRGEQAPDTIIDEQRKTHDEKAHLTYSQSQ